MARPITSSQRVRSQFASSKVETVTEQEFEWILNSLHHRDDNHELAKQAFTGLEKHFGKEALISSGQKRVRVDNLLAWVFQDQDSDSGPPVPTQGQRGDFMRALSVDFLSGKFLKLFGVHDNPELTVLNIEPKLREFSAGTCPRDGEEGCAYVDAAPDEHAGNAKYMLSYTWRYKIKEIEQALSSYCQKSKLSARSVQVWMCFACINQHRVQKMREMGETIPFNKFQNEFGERVRQVDTILALMSPWERPAYLGRVWCVFECSTAIRENKEMVILMPESQEEGYKKALLDGDYGRVYDALSGVHVEKAEASVFTDKENIMKLIEPDMQDYQKSPKVAALNKEVREKLQAWFIDTAAGQIERRLEEGHSVSLKVHGAICKLLTEAVGQHGRARELLQRGLKHDQVPSFDRAVALHRLGRTCIYENIDQARSYYEESRTMFSSMSLHRVKSDVYEESTASVEYAELLGSIGMSYVMQGQLEEARKWYTLAQESYEFNHYQHTPAFAMLMTNIGASYADQNNIEEARKHYQIAQETYEKANETSSPSYAQLLKKIGATHAKQGAADEARKYYAMSKSAFELAGANRTPEYAALLKSTALTYDIQGNMSKARDYYQQAESVYQIAGATNSPDYANLLKSIGTSYARQGKQDMAREYFEQARSTFEQSGSDLKGNSATLLVSIGASHAEQGDQEKARDYYDQAKCAYERIGGTVSTSYARLLTSIGVAFGKQNKTEESSRYYAEAESVFEKCVKPETLKKNIDFANLQKHIGANFAKKADIKPAREHYGRAQTIYENANATLSPDYATLLKSIGLTYSKAGEHEKALPYFEKAADSYKQAGAIESVNNAKLLKCIGDSYVGNIESQRSYYEKAQQTYDVAGACCSGDYAGLLRSIGRISSDSGDEEKALKLYDQSKEVYEKVGITSGPNYLTLLCDTGSSHAKLGKLERARSYYEQANDAWPDKFKRSSDYAGLMRSIGASHAREKQIDKAREFYETAKHVYESSDLIRKVGYASLLKSIGVTHLKSGDGKTAMAYFDQSRAAFKAAHAENTKDYATLLKSIAETYTLEGQFKEAHEYFDQALKALKSANVVQGVNLASLHFGIGQTYERQGDTHTALQHYSIAKKMYDDAGASDLPKYGQLKKCMETLGATPASPSRQPTGLWPAGEEYAGLDDSRAGSPVGVLERKKGPKGTYQHGEPSDYLEGAAIEETEETEANQTLDLDEMESGDVKLT